MAIPTSKSTFKSYCLRALGDGVIDINISDDQADDRIEEALQYFSQYHFDGVKRTYLKYEYTQADHDRILQDTPESISKTYGDSTVVTTNWKEGNSFIVMPESVISVINMFPFSNKGNFNMFDVRYQMHLNALYDLSSMSLINYDFDQRRISQLEDIFNQAPQFRYNRHMDRLYLDVDWDDDEVVEGKFILVDCYRITDPSSYSQVYNDIFLKKYTTQLFKRQWGSNLIKFEGMQLPGGITLNGRQLYDDAQQEITKLEEEMMLRYQLPDDFMVG